MSQRWPVAGMRHNILWTRYGVAWGLWRLQGLAYGHARLEDKRLVRAHHQALFQAVVGESMLLGLTHELDPAAVAERMTHGVDLGRHPGWAQEIRRSMAELEAAPPGGRSYWLAAPLGAGTVGDQARAAVRGADAVLRAQLGLRCRVPQRQEFTTLLRAAEDVHRAIPAAFAPAPATIGQLLWINDHLQHRGLGLDAPLPDGPAPTAPPEAGWHSGAVLGNPWMDEGGQSDQHRLTPRLTPFRRRYLKLQHPATEAISYQVLLGLTGTPRAGFAFPGGEFLAAVDDLPVAVDFAVRMLTTPAEKVKRRNRRAEANLNDQYTQQESDYAITGGHTDLDAAAESLSAYTAALSRTDLEVEVQPTVILAVGAPTPENARAQAQYVIDHYKAHEWVLSPPLGGQEDLWWAMVPGTTRTRLVTELAQITTGAEFAMGIPLVSTEVGEAAGFQIADNITAGRRTPVLMNPAGNAELDTSGSFAVTGEKGSGKSTFLKTVASHAFDRGARLVIIDRSDNTEWAHFARTLNPSRTTIVDLTGPAYSMDPLRVFPAATAARMTRSLCTVLFTIPVMSDEGATLARLTTPDYAAAHGIGSLTTLRQHLLDPSDPALSGLQREICAGLAAKLNVIASTDFGAVLFDDTLPVMPLDGQALVFCTHGLDLPRREELLHESLKADLRLEKVFGRAMYSLMAAIGRSICFAHDTEEAYFLVDEAHHMVGASPEAQAEIADFLRYDRKHTAALGLGSHVAIPDFGPPELRALIPQRLVFRHRDEDAARANLNWFAKYDTDEWVVKVTRDLSPVAEDGVAPARRGEALFRDAHNRIATIQVLLPRNPHRRAAVLSTPGQIHPQDPRP